MSTDDTKELTADFHMLLNELNFFGSVTGPFILGCCCEPLGTPKWKQFPHQMCTVYFLSSFPTPSFYGVSKRGRILNYNLPHLSLQLVCVSGGTVGY